MLNSAWVQIPHAAVLYLQQNFLNFIC